MEKDPTVYPDVTRVVSDAVTTIEREITKYTRYIPQVSDLIATITESIDRESSSGSTDSSQVVHTCPGSVGPLSRYSAEIFEKEYEGLCVGVGGARAILEAGALHEFWVRGLLKNLKYYSGSSAGSMFCYLLAIGYEPVDILTTFCSTEFVSSFAIPNFMNIPSICGLYPSSVIRNKLEQMTMLKIGYVPTFSELMEKHGKSIIVTAYCLSEKDVQQRRIYFSPSTSPNMAVIDAVVLSCSIPLIFQRAVYEGKVYIDGAYTSLFPIQALQNVVPEQANILGIFLEENRSSCDTFFGYVSELISISLREQDRVSGLRDRSEVLQITDSNKTSALNFNMSRTDKMALFTNGTKQVQNLAQSIARSRSSVSSQSNDHKEKTE